MTSTAYWGPPVRADTPQSALSVDLGADTNVVQISFRSDGMAPTRVVGRTQDRLTGQILPIRSVGSLRVPLSASPDWLANLPNVRTTILDASGLSAVQALARAQGIADASTDSLTATGTLDVLRYGRVLQARRLVGLRGAGRAHDGLYYVKGVTHRISRGEYTQDFVLTRDGTGSTVPAVLT
jgi:hypothetical protein